MKKEEKERTTDIRISEPERIKTAKTISVTKMDAEGRSHEEMVVAMEEALVDLWMDGTRKGSVPCTPEHVPELVAGWLLTEGHIDDIQTIEEIRIEQKEESQGGRLLAQVRSKGFVSERGEPIAKEQRKEEQSSALLEERNAIRGIATFLKDRFDEERPLRKETKASHSCMLAQGDRHILYQSEDAGRHSAMDKAIGWGLLRKIDLTQCFLFTSGRISAAMAGKAIRAGVIGLITAKPLVTSGAVSLARASGLWLVGVSDDRNLVVFSEADRG